MVAKRDNREGRKKVSARRVPFVLAVRRTLVWVDAAQAHRAVVEGFLHSKSHEGEDEQPVHSKPFDDRSEDKSAASSVVVEKHHGVRNKDGGPAD